MNTPKSTRKSTSKSTRKSSHKTSQQQPELDLNDFLPYLLVNLSKNLSATLAEIYQREYDLTIPEWRVMANLNQAGTLTSKEIGLQVYLDKVKVSRAIKSLADKGWILKKSHATDSRAYLVSLSARGQKVINDLIPKVLDWERELLSSLDKQEYRQLLQIISKLSQQLDGAALSEFVARSASDL